MTRRPARTNRGQTSLLIVGFAVVLMMMVAVVVDASAAFLRRQQLNALADAAALAAADGVQGEQVYLQGLGDRAVIDPAAAERFVAEYLAAVGASSRYPGFRYDVRADPDSVVVTVSAPLDLPFTPPGWQETARVTGTASAYVLVQD